MIRGRSGDLMFCFEVDASDPNAVQEILQELKKVYNEERSKFSPPMEIIDIGKISESINPLSDTPEYVSGVCIASVVGANREWFLDLLKKAVRRVAKKDRRQYSIYTWQIPHPEIILGKKNSLLPSELEG